MFNSVELLVFLYVPVDLNRIYPLFVRPRASISG